MKMTLVRCVRSAGINSFEFTFFKPCLSKQEGKLMVEMSTCIQRCVGGLQTVRAASDCFVVSPQDLQDNIRLALKNKSSHFLPQANNYET
jgi:hypothetical protein